MTIYYKSPEAARDAGELDMYRESIAENRRTRKAIDDAIAARFDGVRLPEETLRDVMAACDADRIALVLAVTVRDRDHDGRFSAENKAWAAGIQIPEDAPDSASASWYICRSHSAILDGFIDMFRRDAHKYSRPEPARTDAAPGQRINAGYQIVSAIQITETEELVIGKNMNAPSPFVVWDCSGGNNYNTGRYCNSYRQAVRILGELLKRYADAGCTAVYL